MKRPFKVKALVAQIHEKQPPKAKPPVLTPKAPPLGAPPPPKGRSDFNVAVAPKPPPQGMARPGVKPLMDSKPKVKSPFAPQPSRAAPYDPTYGTCTVLGADGKPINEPILEL